MTCPYQLQVYLLLICYVGCLEDKNCDGGYECIDGTCRYLRIMTYTFDIIRQMNVSFV